MKLIKKTYEPYSGNVHDLQIKTSDHSYNVEGLVVHNSVAGSLIACLVGMTTVDPIKHNLLFERFLNKTRIMPERYLEISIDGIGTLPKINESFFIENKIDYAKGNFTEEEVEKIKKHCKV